MPLGRFSFDVLSFTCPASQLSVPRLPNFVMNISVAKNDQQLFKDILLGLPGSWSTYLLLPHQYMQFL